MTDRILLEIGEAEMQAAEIENAAAQKARDKISAARAEAKQILEASNSTVEKQLIAARKNLEEKSSSYVSEKLREAESSFEQVKHEATKQLNSAVAFIVEGVVREYGHS